MKPVHAFAVFFIVISLFVALPARATPLLSNLTDPPDGGFLGGPDSADDLMTGNTALTITDVDIFWVQGGMATRVGIFTDSAGSPSDTQVGNWFTNPTAITNNTLLRYSGSAVLDPKTIYWMVVNMEFLDTSQIGFIKNQVVFSDPSTQGATIIPGSAYGDIQTVSWTADGANLLYALHGSAAVPEPASIALLGLGIAGIGYQRRKRSMP